jgi:hypothetical protein
MLLSSSLKEIHLLICYAKQRKTILRVWYIIKNSKQWKTDTEHSVLLSINLCV